MKFVLAASFADSAALEFSELIRDFDARHAGTTIQVIADAALPADLRPVFARLASGFQVCDPRRFGFDRDSD